MDSPHRSLATVVFAYAPAGLTAKGLPAAAGGVAVSVSQAAALAIKTMIVDDDGRLPMSARAALERFDERESGATDLAVLIRALGRRDVFVR